MWDDANCLRCPRTAAVLRAVPGLTTGFFSILGPGKRLPPHHGPYRGVLRHHLAVLFLDVKRPLRQPVRSINDAIVFAVSRSPFVRAAREQHVAREAEFTRAWDALDPT